MSSYNEWDPLEEVVVGRIEGARTPTGGWDLWCVDFYDLESPAKIRSGAVSERIIEETAEDLDVLAAELTRLGVKVHRPEPLDFAHRCRTPDWESDGLFNYCPRDVLLVAGETVIEAPMVLRSRQIEPLAYRSLMARCVRGGTRWIAAPRPRLLDSVYRATDGEAMAIDESEPLFDAANVARCGRDLFYLVSNTGNALGARWLSSALGPEFRVHPLAGLRNTSHIDTTLVFIRPGLLFVAAPFVTPAKLPASLRGWEVVHFDDIVDIPEDIPLWGASKWIGMNLLMVNPSLAVVDPRQEPLIRALERRGVDTLRLSLRHARALGGGFHCVTLDLRRRGSLESYVD